VVFDPEAFKDQVAIDKEEVTDYYESNIAEFKSEKTVEARHILIKLNPDADQTTDLAAKTRAEALAKKAKDGQDFAELAKAHSEGPTKDRGGYLGKFTRSQMVKPFADKAFSMAAGEISEPVKTQFGWHVIKVESVEEAATKSLEQSREVIVSTLTDSKARSLAYDRAEQFYDASFDKDDLVNNAKAFAVAVKETDSFSRQGPDLMGKDKGAFASAAFALKVDEISDIQDIGGRYFLIQVTETIDAAVPELEAVKTMVEADLIKKMQIDKAMNEAEAMAADLLAGESFEACAAKRSMPVKQTGLFTRDATIPDIGSDPKFTEAAFQLALPGNTSQEPVRGAAGFYLLRLVERKAPAADGFETEKEEIKQTLLQKKQATIIQDWIDARKADSQISIEKAFLE
jgi:peptidyl-prolyl cis-trans isomerase D